MYVRLFSGKIGTYGVIGMLERIFDPSAAGLGLLPLGLASLPRREPDDDLSADFAAALSRSSRRNCSLFIM